MKPHLVWPVLAVLLAGGAAGCGKKEIEELKGKVAGLERELAESRARLDSRDKELGDAQAALAAKEQDLNKVRVERDKCKQELAALKKKSSATPTKKK